METRPFFKRITDFWLKKRKPKPVTTLHEFPLPAPKPTERVTVKRKRSRYRLYSQPPSRDPRFNHALRPAHIARAKEQYNEAALVEKLKARIITVEKLPDSCLPDDKILNQLGFEKLD